MPAGSRGSPRIAGSRRSPSMARTRAQLYSGSSDWRAIGEVKDAVSIPVVGNGDVATIDDAETLLAQSGADGVMIGRGTYGPSVVPATGAPFPGHR